LLSKRRLLALCAPLAGLGGCGLAPMYAGGSQGVVARGLSDIQVSSIDGQSGWIVRNALVDRFGNGASAAPRYRLDVRLDERLQGLGLLADDAVTRERRTLRARYQLVELGTGKILLDATAGADAGVDIVSSEYAVIAAEQTALENIAREVAGQMATRIAVRLQQPR
jgi:LPS-assembly lipoprotein